MSGPIVVINPNANAEVTAAIDASVAPLRVPGGPTIECLTSPDGPFGVQSQADADAAVAPLIEIVKSRPDASAFVLACFSDPGIDDCRAATDAPVFGIQESGLLAAFARGALVGVIAIAAPSIDRHRRYMRRMGVLNRIANERALNISVADSARGGGVLERMIEVGRLLIEDGAEAIVMGCAGMAAQRAPLEEALGVPVIEPTYAATLMALGEVLRDRGR